MDDLSYLRECKTQSVPRIANCWTGSLRSRRAFLVAEAMLAVDCELSPLVRLSRSVACETKGRAREESVKGG
jgi:hypothetical protein